MFIGVVSHLIFIIPVLINVAFITLLERKVLGLSQSRKGPNKIAFMGIFQPFSDAIKLFSKELVFPSKSNSFMFFMSPLVLMVLMLLFWGVLPLSEGSFSWKLSVVFFMSVLSLNIYPLFFSGWGSNSKYSVIGSIRGVSQAISYEISLSLILFLLCLLPQGLDFLSLLFVGSYYYLFFLMIPVGVLWVISCVAETNRTPFDFSEGESELVSGFNVEYSSYLFAMLFMSEYGMILFLSALSGILFFTVEFSGLFAIFLMLMLAFFWIWLRATFPRFRYDKLMNLGWKVILPLVILFILFFCAGDVL